MADMITRRILNPKGYWVVSTILDQYHCPCCTGCSPLTRSTSVGSKIQVNSI